MLRHDVPQIKLCARSSPHADETMKYLYNMVKHFDWSATFTNFFAHNEGRRKRHKTTTLCDIGFQLNPRNKIALFNLSCSFKSFNRISGSAWFCGCVILLWSIFDRRAAWNACHYFHKTVFTLHFKVRLSKRVMTQKVCHTESVPPTNKNAIKQAKRNVLFAIWNQLKLIVFRTWWIWLQNKSLWDGCMRLNIIWHIRSDQFAIQSHYYIHIGCIAPV